MSVKNDEIFLAHCKQSRKKNYLKLLRLMIKQECFQKFIFYEAFMNNSIYIGKGNFLFILLFRKIDSRSFLSMLAVSSNTSFRI